MQTKTIQITITTALRSRTHLLTNVKVTNVINGAVSKIMSLNQTTIEAPSRTGKLISTNVDRSMRRIQVAS